MFKTVIWLVLTVELEKTTKNAKTYSPIRHPELLWDPSPSIVLTLLCSHARAFWHVSFSFASPALWDLTADSFPIRISTASPAFHLLLRWDWSSQVPAGFSSFLWSFGPCGCRASPRIYHLALNGFPASLNSDSLFSFCLWIFLGIPLYYENYEIWTPLKSPLVVLKQWRNIFPQCFREQMHFFSCSLVVIWVHKRDSDCSL